MLAYLWHAIFFIHSAEASACLSRHDYALMIFDDASGTQNGI